MTPYSSSSTGTPLSVLDLAEMKQQAEKITCLTAYDASFSTILDQAGVDVLLVGDSLGMVFQGLSSTVPVSMSDMIYHTRCVSNARQRALVIADMPFMSYATIETAGENAAKLMQEGGAQMVKLEGARIEVIKMLVENGIPVCGHLGLLPQSINRIGRYRVLGKEGSEANRIIDDAKKLEQAGVSMLVLECIPEILARKITGLLSIPVIGIGASMACDGQVLVLYDMLGISIGKSPRFSRNFMANASDILGAVRTYVKDVKDGSFPGPEHCY